MPAATTRCEHLQRRMACVATLFTLTLAPVVSAQRPPASSPERIVAIGDLHGDMLATRTALRLAGAIDSSDHWIGGKLVVVQTGDLLDRGNDEVAMLALFRQLAAEAARAGGAVKVLNGNHELMQAYFDFRYTTDSGFRSFADTTGIGSVSDIPDKVKPEQRGRALAFHPGRNEAMELAARPLILIEGSSVFVHGGVLPWHAARGIDSLNAEASAWLRGKIPQPDWIKGSDRSPVWTRLYSKEPDQAACDSARLVLNTLGVKRMVVGHSIQKGGITSYCNGAVWAIDVGMSAFSGGKVQVLEIRGDSVRTLGPVDLHRAKKPGKEIQADQSRTQPRNPRPA